MRLRIVVPADVDQPSGGNVYDLSLAAALVAGGDEVDVVRCGSSGLDEVLNRPWVGPTLVDGLLACPRPDLLIATQPSRISVLVHMPLALETGLSLDRAETLDRREREALRAATQVIATGHWAADYLRQHHQLAHVSVAAPGVDPADLMTGSDPPLLVQVAALLPHKNQLGVVAALSNLTDLAWTARLVGPVDRDIAYAAAVRDAIQGAGLDDRIEVTGAQPRGVGWAGADLALLPSLVETYGMVVTEALARGVPVVVSAAGSVEALGLAADGERPGIVVPPNEVAALTAALRHWLTEPAYRERLHSRALSRRSTLEGWQTTAEQVRAALSR